MDKGSALIVIRAVADIWATGGLTDEQAIALVADTINGRAR